MTRLLAIGGGSVVLALALLLVLAKMDARHWHKQSDQFEQLAANYKAQLDAISSDKNAQKVITKTKIETVTRTIHDKAKEAEKVEKAPLPGNCRSPKEVLDADI